MSASNINNGFVTYADPQDNPNSDHSYRNNICSPCMDEVPLCMVAASIQNCPLLSVQDVNLFFSDMPVYNPHETSPDCSDPLSSIAAIEDESVFCPASLVACLIGKGGKTIGYIQEKSKTKIQIERSDEAVRRVSIRGKEVKDVEKAKEMVYSILGSGCSELYYSNNNSYQYGISRALECPKVFIGRVIGKQGRTMRMLESVYSVKISVFQGADPCTINIFGTDTSVDRATQSIHLVVDGLNPIDVVSRSFAIKNLEKSCDFIW